MDVSGTVDKILRQKSGEIWSITPDATVYDAIKLMAEKNVGALLVMEDDSLVGIVSERDYSRKVMLRGKTSRTATVREIMTTEVLCCSEEQDLDDVAARMAEARVRRVPVVDRAGRLIGILSLSDVVLKHDPETAALTVWAVCKPGGPQSQGDPDQRQADHGAESLGAHGHRPGGGGRPMLASGWPAVAEASAGLAH